MNNGRRDLWVTYTALTTALNTSYMASQIALFGLVVGIALLLSGIGFLILAIGGALEGARLAFGLREGAKTRRSRHPGVKLLRRTQRRPPAGGLRIGSIRAATQR